MKKLILIIGALLLIGCGPSEEEIARLEQQQKEEIARLEQQKEIEVAKCVRYNSDLVYQHYFGKQENFIKSMEQLDKSIDDFNKAMGNSPRPPRRPFPEELAKEERNNHQQELKSECEKSLFFIWKEG